MNGFTLAEVFSSHSVNQRCVAFTLAEVLITLGIIGVVAAMTMPTLIQNHKTKETVSRVKKAYSVISNAYSLAKNEHGEFSEWGLQNSFASSTANEDEKEQNTKYRDTFWNILGEQLNIVSQCKSADSECTKYETIYKLDGTPITVGSAIYDYVINLNDGTSLVGGYIINANCTNNQVCGDFAVDINGVKKGPNTLGKDIFAFNIMQNKIIPMGDANNTGYSLFSRACNMTSTYNTNGYGCTAWLMYNENMDYLYCDDLSWEGKHKCK